MSPTIYTILATLASIFSVLLYPGWLGWIWPILFGASVYIVWKDNLTWEKDDGQNNG